jgi:CxxC motif-containing protein (DUF1111 family)/tetratricopeptide (TPR) repeat protein
MRKSKSDLTAVVMSLLASQKAYAHRRSVHTKRRIMNLKYLAILLVTTAVLCLGGEFACRYYLFPPGESAFRHAKMAEEAGDFAGAVDYLEIYLGFHPGDDEAFASYALLVDKIAQGGPPNAQRRAFLLLEQAIGRCPDRTDLLLRSAALAMQFERFPTAQEHLKKLVKLDPNDEFACWQLKSTKDIILHRAKMAEEAGDFAKAVDYLGGYLGFQPDDEEVFADYALLLVKIAQEGSSPALSDALSHALSLLEQAIGRCPNRADLLRRSADLAMHLERYSTAQEHLKKLVELDPKEELARCQLNHLKLTADSLLLRAKMAEEAGDLTKAAEHLRSCVRYELGDDDAFAESALLFDRLAQGVPPQANLDQAFSHLEKAIRRCPNRTDLLRRSVALAMELEQYPKAQAHLKKLFELDPKALNKEDSQEFEKFARALEKDEPLHHESKSGQSRSPAQVGYELFHHEWKLGDSLSPWGDGLGPVFNARSCIACHNQGGSGGGGSMEHNVTSFRVSMRGEKPREGVLHAGATKRGFLETLSAIDPALPALNQQELDNFMRKERILLDGRGRQFAVSQVNTPALFGSGLIDALPEQVLIEAAEHQRMKFGNPPKGEVKLPVGRVSRLANGRIGKFGWKAQTARLSDFVQAACANELGLGNPKHPQPKPLGKLQYEPPGLDLTQQQCDQLTAYVASLDRPVERQPIDIKGISEVAGGKQLFSNIGCADCHAPRLGDVEGIYSDLLLHRMGDESAGGAGYRENVEPQSDPSGPEPSEWRTPPLWGVADSAPYLHDGRAETLEEAIRLHGGQGKEAASRFAGLSEAEKHQLISFLKTLRAPGLVVAAPAPAIMRGLPFCP